MKLELTDDEAKVLGYLLVDATSGWGEPLKDIESDGKFKLNFRKADRALASLAKKMGVKPA